ncbi:NUDIX hydrolase N-terminal domain-containing protein [Imperialibacter roseus]|uniref:NUDIX hydrolase N-terminal domain-containing protein n=1 Tax=Imperialibacter roseus TaxID=1324217 RepID=A0ABZ0IJW4_9BACT|nr:NUDIX hydrolase N-terminal domain-containing protein [Imperialibacter roseus]WOK05312.1 NUDIX hydrolase N-terminal domain-containing protein [Imperialibacter roseus]
MVDPTSLLSSLLRIKTLSQIGINFGNSEYDLERYEEIVSIADQLIAGISDMPIERIQNLYANEESYITPKVDVRTIVLKNDQILLIKEKADGRWALPGGWAEVGYTPSAVAVKEVREETGLDVKIERLLAVFDNSLHQHPPSPFYVYKLFFLGTATGGSFDLKGHESLEVGFFSLQELPPLSEERNTYEEIHQLATIAAQASNQQTLFD